MQFLSIHTQQSSSQSHPHKKLASRFSGTPSVGIRSAEYTHGGGIVSSYKFSTVTIIPSRPSDRSFEITMKRKFSFSSRPHSVTYLLLNVAAVNNIFRQARGHNTKIKVVSIQ